MQYETKPRTESVEYIVLTRNEYDTLNNIFKDAMERNYSDLSTSSIPDIDHMVMIGGYYRREFIVNVKD